MTIHDDEYQVRTREGEITDRGAYEVEHERSRGTQSLRIFQVLTAATGAILFLVGLLAVFEVSFDGDRIFDTTGEVAGFGFSAALAGAALVLGAGILIASLADQSRTGAAIVAFLAILVGIAALVANDQPEADISVERGSAALFIVLGAVAFVLSLIPWWSGRQDRTVVRR